MKSNSDNIFHAQALVAQQLREHPGHWAVTYQELVTNNQGIPSVYIRDLAYEINTGNGPWSPSGAFEAVIRKVTESYTELFVRYLSDEPEVSVTYRASLTWGSCFGCGRPAGYLLLDTPALCCALCAAEAAVTGSKVGKLMDRPPVGLLTQIPPLWSELR